jgi:hypothetical protein
MRAPRVRILNLGIRRGEWSASRPGRSLAKGERTPGTHCTGGWVGPRAGLDTEATGKIISPVPGIKSISLGFPAVARRYTD